MDRDPINFFLDGEKNKNEGKKSLKRANKKKYKKYRSKKTKAKELAMGRDPFSKKIDEIWDGCQKIARPYGRDGEEHAIQRSFAGSNASKRLMTHFLKAKNTVVVRGWNG